MMDDSFKFFVDQVVSQYKELKADIRGDLASLKEELKDHQRDQDEKHSALEKRVKDLEGYRSYLAGAAMLAFVLAELLGKGLEYFFSHRG